MKNEACKTKGEYLLMLYTGEKEESINNYSGKAYCDKA